MFLQGDEMKLPKFLFFIADCNPSDEEREAANSIGNAHICFRNASAVSDEDHAIESCDGVAGLVPKQYENCKGFDVAIEKVEKEKKDLQEKIGDTKPPVAPASNPNIPPWNPKG